MDLYTIGCTIEPPIVWYIQKCMLIGKICFYFSFVYAWFGRARNMARLHFWRTDRVKIFFSHINIHFWIYQTMGGSIVHPMDIDPNRWHGQFKWRIQVNFADYSCGWYIMYVYGGFNLSSERSNHQHGTGKEPLCLLQTERTNQWWWKGSPTRVRRQ